jgi:ankyrin repeat protein
MPTTPHGGALRVRWRVSMPGLGDVRTREGSILTADLDGDGRTEIVVRGPKGAVVLDRSGKYLRTIPLSTEMQQLAACRAPHGAYLIGFGTWSEGVEARDRNGKRLWRFVAKDDAVDWACPVDVQSPDGDAVAIGYNGDGGVRLVSAKGDLLWRATADGNVWHVGSAHLTRGEPASVLAAPDAIWVLGGRGHLIRKVGTDSQAGTAIGADLDGDGVDEILGMGAYQDGDLSAYSSDGTLRWRHKIYSNFAHLEPPVAVGAFWPAGRQVALGFSNGTAALFDAGGQPLSFLRTGEEVLAFAALEHGAGTRDALLTVTTRGITCYEWKPGAESAIPVRLLVPPPPPPEPPLINAVLKKDAAAVQALVAKHVSPETRNSQGSQAIVVAASRGFTAVVEALLNGGAEVNVYSKSGETPLLEAAETGHADVVKILLARHANPNLPSIGAKISFGTTPLMSAAMDGNMSVVKLLLDAGASVNADQNGMGTALHQAASQGHTQVADLLIAHGAKVDARTCQGETPLMEAAMAGRADVVKLLIAHGANVNACDDQTRRYYGRAQFMGAKAAMKQIEKSGKLNARRQDGMSVLDTAIIGKNPEVIKLLEAAGARPHSNAK